MSYFEKIKKFTKNITPWGISQTTGWKSPGVPMELIPYSDPWPNKKTDPVRRAVYTEYFWLNPPFGKPRNIDYPQLKIIESSVWTEMCITHITDSIANAEWSILPKNDNKKVSERKIDEVYDFFESKEWQESFKIGIRKMIPDLINYDCGIFVKVYPVGSYIKDREYMYTLKNNHGPCLEMVSRDGRSFLKSTDIYGNIDAYYQYSWIHPNARPIRFSPDEVIYIQHKPSSRSPYGRCNLEIIEDILEYLKNSSESQEKYWKNGMFVGGQIDHPDIVDLKELMRYSEYYRDHYKGVENTNKWMITGGNTKVTPLSFTPHDMQWLDGQKWFAKLVMSIYQVTPSELGFTEDINRATGVQQMNIHKSRAIRPLLNLIEDYINRYIIWSDFYDTIKFQYIPQLDLDDRRKIAEINKILIESNIATINEARKDDGKDSFEDERFDKTMLEIQEEQQKAQQEAQQAMFEQQQAGSEESEIPETEYGEESAMEIPESENEYESSFFEESIDLEKTRVYIKPEVQVPKGVTIHTGPKGGKYFETESKVAKPKEIESKIKAPKIPDSEKKEIKEEVKRFDLKNMNIDELKNLIKNNKLNQNELHELIEYDDSFIREDVAKRIDLDGLHIMMNDNNLRVRGMVAKRIDLDSLHIMMNDKSVLVREEVAKRIDQKNLYKMINDWEEDIRLVVAERINKDKLHEMINDENENIRLAVSKRLDQNDLHKMINDDGRDVRIEVAQRINEKGLHKMINDEDKEIREIVNNRIETINKIRPMIDSYNKNKEIILSNDTNKKIKDVMKEKIGLYKDEKYDKVMDITDEFYKNIEDGKYSSFYMNSKRDWITSSSSPLALLLKDSIKRQFGGKIRHHDEIYDYDKEADRLYGAYDKEMVDEYVKIQKELTRKYLDVMFPDSDEITLYRGTTSKEMEYKNGDDKKVIVKSNPVSSWSSNKNVAGSFARNWESSNDPGLIITMKTHKDNICATFMNYGYATGHEEMLVIGNKDKESEINTK